MSFAGVCRPHSKGARGQGTRGTVALRAVSVLRYRRVVVKLSGRAFAGAADFGVDNHALGNVADQLIAARVLGIQQAVVVGGGNFFRGNVADDWSIERAEADNIGMLGTVMNGILMRGVLKHRGLDDVRLMTAVPIQSVAEPFIRLRAISHLEREHLVLLAAGIGQPYVTTDYASVQRAIEVRAEAILLAKHGVDGIYDSDPRTNPNARRYDSLGYNDVLERDLRVMDQTAIVLARDHGLPLHVFDFDERDAITKICHGENRGTYISPETTLVTSKAA